MKCTLLFKFRVLFNSTLFTAALAEQREPVPFSRTHAPVFSQTNGNNKNEIRQTRRKTLR